MISSNIYSLKVTTNLAIRKGDFSCKIAIDAPDFALRTVEDMIMWSSGYEVIERLGQGRAVIIE